MEAGEVARAGSRWACPALASVRITSPLFSKKKKDHGPAQRAAARGTSSSARGSAVASAYGKRRWWWEGKGTVRNATRPPPSATAHRSSLPRNSRAAHRACEARTSPHPDALVVSARLLLSSGIVAVSSFVLCPGVSARCRRSRPRCSPLCLQGLPLRRRPRHATMSMAAVTQDHDVADVRRAAAA
ncbi:hypothetical protein SEVIR_7G110401v4 [Setaria viridis]